MKNIRTLLILAVFSTLLLGACRSDTEPTAAPSMGAMEIPADLDTAVTRLSDQGLFRATFSSELDPIAINQMHSWTLHLENADGDAVEGAEITVDGGMPQHDHGLPTAPEVTQELGGGDYLVEGMRFQMSGWWEVTFAIDAAGERDSVTFNLILE